MRPGHAPEEARLEGVWTIDIHGPYDWREDGVLVLERGRVAGGGNGSVSLGRYRVFGSRVEAEMAITCHGRPRTVFGEACRSFAVHFDGTLRGDTISGELQRPDRRRFNLLVRLIKRRDLNQPALSVASDGVFERQKERAQA